MVIKIFFGLLLLGGFIYTLFALYIFSLRNLQAGETTDTAIVLGARSYIHGQYNPCLVSRVEAAISLLHDGKVRNLLFSGGTDKEDNKNEAEVMKKMAIERGIGEEKILLEKASTSTYENLLYAQALVKEHNIPSITIVTESFHMARVRLVAKSLGINAEYEAVQNSPCWNIKKPLSLNFLKEPVLIIYYLLTGKIHA